MELNDRIAGVLSLRGEVAVVTGAGSGLGQEAAHVLALAGADTMLADLDVGRLEQTAALVRKAGRRAGVHQVDMADKQRVEGLADATLKEFGKASIWVNVAGMALLASVVDTMPADAERLLAVNALGVQWGCAAAGRIMKDNGGGAIVNVSSAGGRLPVPNMSTYCMSKAAVNQFTRVCARELGPFGIRVNAVAPGWIETPMGQNVFRNADGEIDQERREKYLSEQAALSPIGELGTPEDVALAILYLASSASRFVTGQVLTVDGGISM